MSHEPNTMILRLITLPIFLLFSISTALISLPAKADDCPEWKNQEFRQLHSQNTFNLCEKFPKQALLIVNTASHCGFTPQFSGLESLHQRYKEQGLAIVGFASNDFNQAAKSEEKAASICYENFGVSFTMAAPISVRGNNAHPLFRALAAQTQAPSWNFNKYLVSADGKTIEYFDSRVSPNSQVMNNRITNILNH